MSSFGQRPIPPRDRQELPSVHTKATCVRVRSYVGLLPGPPSCRIHQAFSDGHLSFEPADMAGLGIVAACRNIAIAPERPSREELA